MAENAEEFIISLQERISGPAKIAESAIAQLETRINAQQGVLGGYEQKLAAAAAKLQMLSEGDARSAVNVKRFRRQQIAVAGLQKALDGAARGMERLGSAKGIAKRVDEIERARAAQEKWNAAVKKHADLRAKEAGATAKPAAEMAKLSKGSNLAKVNVGELLSKVTALGGPLGKSAAGAGKLGGMLQKLGAVGAAGIVIGIAIAVVALAAAFAAAVVAATSFAVKMADASRNQRLSVESLAAGHKVLVDIGVMLPLVQEKTGLAAGEIQKLAAQLAKAKVPAVNLENALQAMATAKAGGATTEFLDKLQKSLIATGKIPAELSAQFAQFKGIAEKKMLSLGSISDRFKRNFAGLFSGLQIEGLLSGLSKVAALFSQSTASGRALKSIMERLFQPLIDGAAKAIPGLIRGFLHITIVILEVLVAAKKLGKALNIKPEFVSGPYVSNLNAISRSANRATLSLKTMNGAMGGASEVAATASTGVAASAAKMGSAWAAAKAATKAGVAEVQSSAAASAGEGAAQTDAVGAQMSAGLAEGILSNAEVVIAAITAVVGGAISAAESQLQTGSPSKLFHRFGKFIDQGLAGGVDEDAPIVERSMRDMVAPKLAGPGAPQGEGGGGAGGRTVEITFSECTFGEGGMGEVEKQLVAIFHRLELEGDPS